MSYHIAKIPCGEFGEISKIEEELCELVDSIDQGNKIMALCELADLIGAIEGYAAKHHSGITLVDLIVMKDATKKAFETGTRTSRNAFETRNSKALGLS